jgi:zinc transport system substrate-binding protein
MINLIKSAIILLIFCFGTGVYSSGQNRAEKPKIYVSVPPLAFFVEQIGGNNFEVVTVIGPGQSPATFETTPRQLTQFSKSKIFFTAGVPFEKHLNEKLKSSFENLNIFDTQKGIKLQYLEHHHHHGSESLNIHEEENSIDPHTWMDPSLAKMMAQNIFDGLIKIYPADSSQFRKNLNLLLDDLTDLDLYIKQELKPFEGSRFYTFHPAFGYFARAYNLVQKAIEMDGKEPSARQLADLIRKAREDDVRVIFTQPQFSDKSARAIAESIDAHVIPIDPLSNDYLNNLKEITNHLVIALKNYNDE